MAISQGPCLTACAGRERSSRSRLTVSASVLTTPIASGMGSGVGGWAAVASLEPTPQFVTCLSRRSFEKLLTPFPVWDEATQQSEESWGMVAFDSVAELMNDHVVNALASCRDQ